MEGLSGEVDPPPSAADFCQCNGNGNSYDRKAQGPAFSPSSSQQLPSASKTEQRKAYVTFLAGDGGYVKGVVALAKSLRMVKSAYPLVVAVLPDVPIEHRKTIERLGCIIREIQPLSPPKIGNVKFAREYFIINYCKLRVWQFEEYSKMVFLDADMLVLKNVDELFDEPPGSFSAALACLCEPYWHYTREYQAGYCHQRRLTVPSCWGEEDVPPPYCNTGMFVFEPSREVLADMESEISKTMPTPFAEQDFLNAYFKKTMRILPNSYNLIFAIIWRHPEEIKQEEVKIAHYCGTGLKPWDVNPLAEHADDPLVKKLMDQWWRTYNAEEIPKLPSADS